MRRTVKEIHKLASAGNFGELTEREVETYYTTCSACYSDIDGNGNCACNCELEEERRIEKDPLYKNFFDN